SDVMMPEMDGYQLLKAVRENQETQHIPVIMLTARASQELKVEGLEAGAIDFLSKPFDRNEIVARVANLMALKRMSQTVDALNRELAESAFKRYLPPELVGKILAGELQFDEEPRTITATVLFSDLAGFTTLSANLRATKTAKLLNEYLTAMNEVIFEHCGTVDKFIGDGIMVIFGAPREMSLEEQSRNATACALHMQRRVEELNEAWSKAGLPKLSMRIGLHQGPVVVGNFGSDKRVEYTAIGSTVNLASRIEGTCEPGRVYLSGEVCDSLSETEFEEAGKYSLKGVPGEVCLFRLAEIPQK
ncbi:MAG: response regulator, partial [Planctomycetaceae bacterium]|nr:response regulator [Planctomycetaceae bacterium]